MTDEELEICERGLRAVVNHYGLLVAKNSDERVVNAATATFVRVDDKHLIVTAHHAVTSLMLSGKVRLQLVTEDAMSVTDTSCVPIEIEVAPEKHLALPLSSGFDVAILPAPRELYSRFHVEWFDANLQVDIVTQLRDH